MKLLKIVSILLVASACLTSTDQKKFEKFARPNIKRSAEAISNSKPIENIEKKF
jgi:hypothetical protein